MKIKYIMYNVHDYSVLYDNVVQSVIGEGRHFTHLYTLVRSHHLTKRAHTTSLTPPRLTKKPVPNQERGAVMYFCVSGLV